MARERKTLKTTVQEDFVALLKKLKKQNGRADRLKDAMAGAEDLEGLLKFLQYASANPKGSKYLYMLAIGKSAKWRHATVEDLKEMQDLAKVFDVQES